MKKIIKNGKSVIVVLDDGTILQNDSCDDMLFEQLKSCTNDSDAALLLLPKLQEVMEERAKAKDFLTKVKESHLLTYAGSSVYWRSISELSMPQNFAERVLQAEDEGNEDALEAYKNFWTLLSLNPDERVRQNLFWYLETWGMRISKTGLFVGYRNVDMAEEGNTCNYTQDFCDFVVASYEKIRNAKKATSDYWVITTQNINTGELGNLLLSSMQVLYMEDEDEMDIVEKHNLRDVYNELKAVNFKAKLAGDDSVFTDHYTHRMKIKIGEMVVLPREECDCDSNVECSSGLHLGGTTWLQQCYFGDCGLACLCNPRDVVAVPHDANYGKLRTCAYLPVARVEYDAEGHVIPLNVDDGFESKWVKTILYDGIKCSEDSPTYKITVPSIPELNKPLITKQILEIARKYMK